MWVWVLTSVNCHSMRNIQVRKLPENELTGYNSNQSLTQTTILTCKSQLSSEPSTWTCSSPSAVFAGLTSRPFHIYFLTAAMLSHNGVYWRSHCRCRKYWTPPKIEVGVSDTQTANTEKFLSGPSFPQQSHAWGWKVKAEGWDGCEWMWLM